MKKKEYLELVDRELKNIRDVIERKNNDYTGDTDSAFANFEATSSLGLSDARMGVLIRMVDKIQRVKTFVQKGELKVKGESAQDAARDIIGYSLILLGMLEPKAEQPAETPKKEDKTFKPTIGKRYKRRDGSITGMLVPSPLHLQPEWPLFDPRHEYSYSDSGYFISCSGLHELDLIEELHGKAD